MAYALIPDGYSLKKVTKLQEQAVNAKRRHDNVEAFFANPNTPPLLQSVGLIAFTTILFDLILKGLQEQGTCPKLTPGEEAEIKKELQRQLLEISPITGGLKSLEEALGRFGLIPGALA